MRFSRSSLVLALAWWAGAGGASVPAAGAVLSSYHAVITLESESLALVRITATHESPGATVDATLLEVPSLRLESLEFATGEGAQTPRVSVRQRLRQFQVAAQMREPHVLAVHYRCVATGGRLERIPLLVPSAQTPPGGRAVLIEVRLPPPWTPLEDSFPPLDWRDMDHGTAQPSNVPAFVRVAYRTEGPQTFGDRLRSPRFLNDVFIAVLLAAGTLIWIARQRRRSH